MVIMVNSDGGKQAGSCCMLPVMGDDGRQQVGSDGGDDWLQAAIG